MKNGLIIGNSHVAMISKAINLEASTYADMALDFFACPGIGPEGVVFNGSKMSAVDPELQKYLTLTQSAHEVDLNTYDFITIVACGVSIFPVVQLISATRLWDHAKDNRPLISHDCFETALNDAFINTLARKLVTSLSAHTNVPIYLICQPYPSENIQAQNRKHFTNLGKYNETAHTAAAFQAAVRNVFSDIPETQIIWQINEALQDHIYTKEAYSVGSVRLHNINQQHPADDILHANHLYGAAILKHLKNI